MDPRVSSIAEAAVRRMGAPATPEAGRALRLDSLTLSQLSNLAALRADDPLVARVLEALRSGAPVLLDRPRTEADLDLGSYPQPLRAQFDRLFARIASLGVALAGEAAPPRPSPDKPAGASPSPVKAATDRPERQAFEVILGAVDPAPHPCFLEPDKACESCSGRCRTLGF